MSVDTAYAPATDPTGAALPHDTLAGDVGVEGSTPLAPIAPLPGNTPAIGPTLSQTVLSNDPNAMDLSGISDTGQKIVAAARHYLGIQYKWGGTSASGVDCSGLVKLAYQAAGIDLPRVSYQQATYGQRIPLGQMRPGDMIAVDNSARNPGADHIAIYIGGGMMIEAPHPGGHVQIVPISYMGKGAWGVRGY